MASVGTDNNRRPGTSVEKGIGIPAVLAIADDLSGANVTGAALRRHGFRTAILRELDGLGEWSGDAPALVANTDSRNVRPEEARRRVEYAVSSVQTEFVSKRVDTTLRGNIAVEIESVLRAVRQRNPERPVRVLMVPAFPSAGRTTIGGHQLVGGVPAHLTAAGQDPLQPLKSSNVIEIAKGATSLEAVHLNLDAISPPYDQLRSALQQHADLVVCDGATDGHLQAIADVAAQISSEQQTNWIPVDPGPFTAHLAKALGLSDGDQPGPVLAVVGSTTELTQRQIGFMQDQVASHFVRVPADATFDPTEAVRELTTQISSNNATVVGFYVSPVREGFDASRASQLLSTLGLLARLTLEDNPVAGLFLSGGDVAAAVLHELDCDGLEVVGEVEPLTVLARLTCERWQKLPIVTKGGLVGDTKTAVRCIQAVQLLAAVDR